MLSVGVVTLFPEMLAALAAGGITGRAMERGVLRVACYNPREHAPDRHRTVDDRPYGGGPGMVMTAEPLGAAIDAARRGTDGARVVYLSPQGRRLTQAGAAAIAGAGRIVLVCGRYEGVDERVVESMIDDEISIGDYVLSGGETAAMVVVDAAARLLPGALGHEDSAGEDSFARGLLEGPHYTRPETLGERRVPSVLLSGDHGAVRRWRLREALGRTWLRRPDLLRERALDAEERTLLAEFVDAWTRAHRGAPGAGRAAAGGAWINGLAAAGGDGHDGTVQ